MRQLSILAIAVSAVALATLGLAARANADATPGKAAPDFEAVDSKGRAVKLSDYKGKIVVLEWTNNGCPYVGKHYGSGNMQGLQKMAAEKGVVWLSIVSSAPGQQGYVSGLEADEVVAKAKASPAAVLLDPQGKVGRLYNAQTTPHMYVVDASGRLAYAGAIDDRPTANPADVKGARNYVVEALDAVLAGREVKTSSTRAYGCSVKYSAAKS